MLAAVMWYVRIVGTHALPRSTLPLAVLNPPEGVVEVPFHLFGGTVHGLIERRCHMGHGHGLHARGAGFENALLVIAAGLVAILIA